MATINNLSGMFVVRIFLLFLPSLHAQVPANVDPVEETVRLEWKFTEGQSLKYQYSSEARTLKIGGTDQSEYIVRKTYNFQWDYMFSVGELTALAVSIDRVIFEIEKPEVRFRIDTDVPLDPRHTDLGKLNLQREAFRALQTRFVFLARADGGVGWPELQLSQRPLPALLRMPTSSNYFSPEALTTGDALALPDRRVRTGDVWTSPAVSVTSTTRGVARYRLAERTQRLGHECREIEGSGIYVIPNAESGAAPHPPAKLERKSHSYFDVEAGLMVLSEETVTEEYPQNDGTTLQTVTTVTRRLRPTQTENRKTLVPRQVAGGQSVDFHFDSGMPSSECVDGVRVVQAGFFISAEPRLNKPALATDGQWNLVLQIDEGKVRAIRLFDIGTDDSIPVTFEKLPDPDERLHRLVFDAVDLESSQADWFFENNTAERIIRILVEFEDRDPVELSQLMIIRTLLLRFNDDIEFPDRFEDSK